MSVATVSSSGVDLYYETHGSGPVIVFAHGAGGNAASWWQQVPYFAERGHRVLAFDHRGFGRSRCDDDHADPALFVSDLLALLDAEGITRAALVCQSMGGWTGLPAAIRHPERVRALVLCGTPGGLMTDAVSSAFREVAARVARQGLTGPGGAALGLSFQKAEPVRAFLYDQIAAFNAVPSGLLGRLQAVRIAPSEVAAFAVPTLVISGDEDVLFPSAALESVAKAIPGAELASFPGAGHSTYFEQPERFNAVVADFLARCP